MQGISRSDVMLEPRPFTIDVPDAVLAEIMKRIERFPHHRLRPLAPADDWSSGPSPAWLAGLCRHWTSSFDWRAHERRLNTLPQFLVELDGLDLHYVLKRGSGDAPRPLLLLHGWPYSFASYAGMVDALAHPERHGGRVEDAFTVVIPSLPGYGFSVAAEGPMGPRRMVAVLDRLMRLLGLPGYIVHGGDWGGYMASLAGLDHPASVRGIHTTYVALRTAEAPLQSGQAPPDASAAEKAYAAREKSLHEAEGAYSEIQSSKPLALAPAMLDSPVGVAAWMVDKFHAWADLCTSDFDTLFPFDWLLTEIMLYLVTDTAETATWIYPASRTEGLVTVPRGHRVEVPTAVAAFPDPAFPVPPRELVARSHNVVRYTSMARGGHFPFHEAPDLLIDDLRAFARTLT